MRWIMVRVESVDYSVLVNNEFVGPINYTGRSLRQGDPLFALIRQAEQRGDLHGIIICDNGPVISHLLLAYDCFLFFRAVSVKRK